jgi:hypothetical protein
MGHPEKTHYPCYRGGKSWITSGEVLFLCIDNTFIIRLDHFIIIVVLDFGCDRNYHDSFGNYFCIYLIQKPKDEFKATSKGIRQTMAVRQISAGCICPY